MTTDIQNGADRELTAEAEVGWSDWFPSDMAEANRQAGAMCGHFALAASLGSNVMDVLKYFPALSEGKTWVSVKTMEQALTLSGREWRSVGAAWPARGVVIVQGLGPWMKQGVPFGARLARTHWIAVEWPRIADANADDWLLRLHWESIVLTDMLRRWRAVGWEVKRGYEIKAHNGADKPHRNNP